tara:strand:+ start:262 stop:1617 length:1356 start_codon:yes stop_codon:yes gene_type:complete
MKPFILIQGPVATRSGYGNHTRDLVTSLIRADKYDIQIISLRWGDTPMDALEHDNSNHQEIAKRIVTGNITKQPDIFIQVSVPNEFGLGPDGKPMKVGKYNIGVTAGIETDVVSPEFLQGCNRMDLILTTSEHSKVGFQKSNYEVRDKNTNNKTGDLKLEKPIEVLFEGADLDTYFKTNKIHKSIDTELSDVKDKFCYLFVGHWLRGELGQDRKDVGMMIKTFCEAFKKKSPQNRPGLILKSSHAHFSIIDRDAIMDRIQQIILPYGNDIPNIYLLHGDLTDDEMNSLYNHPKVKAMVSFTKGEGYGRPLQEFSLSGKPVIASNWSGHVDFLHKDYCTLLPGQLNPVHKSAQDNFIVNQSKWFTVNYQYAAKVLQDCIKNYKSYCERSRKQPQYIKDNFSLEKMSKEFCKYIDKGLSNMPQQVSLSLPKLKKTETSKEEKIKLPKLKKVEA